MSRQPQIFIVLPWFRRYLTAAPGVDRSRTTRVFRALRIFADGRRCWLSAFPLNRPPMLVGFATRPHRAPSAALSAASRRRCGAKPARRPRILCKNLWRRGTRTATASIAAGAKTRRHSTWRPRLTSAGSATPLPPRSACS